MSLTEDSFYSEASEKVARFAIVLVPKESFSFSIPSFPIVPNTRGINIISRFPLPHTYHFDYKDYILFIEVENIHIRFHLSMAPVPEVFYFGGASTRIKVTSYPKQRRGLIEAGEGISAFLEPWNHWGGGTC